MCWSGAYISDAYIKDRAPVRCCRPLALSHQSVQSGSPKVTMVQPTQSGLRGYPTKRHGWGSAVWRFFPESKVGAIFVVIGNVFTEQPLHVSFIERDDVIQQLPAAAADPCHSARDWRRKSAQDSLLGSERQQVPPPRIWRHDQK